MKYLNLKLAVFVMVLALLGLISIQFFWIDSAVALKESQFEQSVGNLLYGVVKKLEQREAVQEVQKHPLGSALYYGKAGNRIQVNVQRDSATSQNLTYHIKQEEVNDTVGNIVRKRTTTRHLISDKDGLEIEARPEELDSLLAILSEERINNMKYRENLVGDVVDKWFSFPFYRKLSDRVTGHELDSIIYSELEERGLHVSYQFGVFDGDGNPVYKRLCPEHGMFEQQVGAYQAKLFPNDIFKSPYYLQLYFPKQKTYLLRTMWVLLASGAIFLFLIVFVFSRTVLTVIRQKRIGEVKNDFINNMTHELKTPISTISLACEALQDQSVQKSEEMERSFVEMIQAENKRLGVLVENALRTAVLDRGQLSLKKDVFDLNQIASEAVANIQIQAKQHQSTISLRLFKGSLKVSIDKVHFTNVIYNLLDNAIKYSGANASIEVITEKQKNHVCIRIKDNGPGISRENQKRVFDKLYRIPTGNLHNVKGYGLGLSYVKAIVEKHSGNISVSSQINKGTTFTIKLPIT